MEVLRRERGVQVMEMDKGARRVSPVTQWFFIGQRKRARNENQKGNAEK